MVPSPNSRVPKTRVDVKTADLGSELVVYDGQLYHQLNATARLIWQLCDGSRDIARIVEEVARYYPAVETERVETDVQHTVSALGELGLIVIEESENGPED
jgi:hypothetical protein